MARVLSIDRPARARLDTDRIFDGVILLIPAMVFTWADVDRLAGAPDGGPSTSVKLDPGCDQCHWRRGT